MNNEFKIEKVCINELIQILQFIQNKEFEFVDLFIIPTEDGDALGIATKEYYKIKEESFNSENIKLSDINLNDLI